MRSVPILAAFALSASLLAGGCTTPAAGGTAGLVGTQWTIASIDGKAPAAPDRARMGFAETRLSASVGCNGIGGEYRVEGDRLIAGPLISTRMFCEGLVGQQEEAVNALLSGAPRFRRNGDRLWIESGGHTLELHGAPAAKSKG